MKYKDEIFGELEWKEEGWYALKEFQNKTILIEIEDSWGLENQYHLEAIEVAKQSFFKLSKEFIEKTELEVSKEFIKDSYCQSLFTPSEQSLSQEINSFKKSLQLKSISFSDDSTMLIWSSSILEKNNYLTTQMELDLTVVETMVQKFELKKYQNQKS